MANGIIVIIAKIETQNLCHEDLKTDLGCYVMMVGGGVF